MLDCLQCGLIYSDPMVGGDSTYYKAHLVYQKANREMAIRHRKAIETRWNTQLLAQQPRGARFLDVGCGFGAFVDLAAHYGLDAYGIDFNTDQIAVGREAFGLGHRLRIGNIADIETSAATECQYDLITLFEVLEHLENPARAIESIRAILKTGALLILSCPNESRWQPTGRIFVDYPPHHLTRWRPDTLRQFAQNHGFDHVRTYLDSSWFDLAWVAYVNYSAYKKSLSPQRLTQGERSSGLSGLMKDRFCSFARSLCVPADSILATLGIGTMGMRVVLRKNA